MTFSVVLSAVVLLTSVLGVGGPAHRKTEAGNQSYEMGDLDDALRSYTDAQTDAPTAPELFYDIGNVLYRQGDFEGAAESYRRSLLSSPSAALESAASFNLGNARSEQEEWPGAIEAYERALRATPGDSATQRNLELAVRALEAQQRDAPEESSEGDPSEEQGDQQSQSSPSEAEPEGEKDKQESDSEPGEGEPEGNPEEGSGDPKSDGGEQQSDSESEKGEAEPGQGKASDGRMSEADAERLLDSVAALEQENLKEHRKQKVRVSTQTREKDW